MVCCCSHRRARMYEANDLSEGRGLRPRTAVLWLEKNWSSESAQLLRGDTTTRTVSRSPVLDEREPLFEKFWMRRAPIATSRVIHQDAEPLVGTAISDALDRSLNERHVRHSPFVVASHWMASRPSARRRERIVAQVARTRGRRREFSVSSASDGHHTQLLTRSLSARSRFAIRLSGCRP